ncbi:MAG TPA: hypothetical protein VMZ66_14935, partial [Aeromicrobium sp.]|nr:hypothetical protein [Aeromicrobium sp.]
DTVVLAGMRDDAQPAWRGNSEGFLFRSADAISGQFGLYSCDAGGGSRTLVAANGEQPAVLRA